MVSPPTDVGRDWDEERFRTALDSHDDDERYRLLDHCRQRAYADDDLMWRSALTLVLARMGRHDEARREMDATSSRCRASALDSATASAIEAKLAEAGSVLDGRLISATRST